LQLQHEVSPGPAEPAAGRTKRHKAHALSDRYAHLRTGLISWRLAAELKLFFGWTASLRGREVGLKVDPARRPGDLRLPEALVRASSAWMHCHVFWGRLPRNRGISAMGPAASAIFRL